jgi:hypothetical protein
MGDMERCWVLMVSDADLYYYLAAYCILSTCKYTYCPLREASL